VARGEYIVDHYVPTFTTGHASSLDKTAKITKAQEAKKVPIGFAAPQKPGRAPRAKRG
jgi:hypothetical protein